MKITKIVILVLFLTSSIKLTYSQNYQSQRNELLAYNVFSNGLISGIGGVIHKKKGEKFFPVFIKSFGKGCLGGLIKYSAKSQTYTFRNSQFNILAPVNRAYFFLGHSISMNASRNEKMLSNYYCNFYGVNFHYDHFAKKGERINSRLSLGTVASILNFSLIKKHKLDFYKTLEFGEFYYDLKPNTIHNGIPISGLAGYNVMAIEKYNGFPRTSVIPHELIHNYQYYDFFSISSFYEKPLNKILDKSSFYKKVTKYIDFDYEQMFFTFAYIMQPKRTYYKNFFEFEAEHFSSRRFIER